MKIVVVEASRVMARGIASLLEERGHEVVTFTNSAEALAFVCADASVDAVLTGLETSPRDGFETCWALRLIANAGRPLYVIAMSSLAHTRNLSEVLDSGADDFISKPIVAEELHARLRAAERMTLLQRALWHQAQRDLLSGLLNRRAFFGKVDEWNENTTNHTSIGLILADLDHFKRLNDCHGHDCGDEAIRRVGALFNEYACTHGGAAARFGGEEFILALPGVDIRSSEAIAEALCRSISEISFSMVAGETVTLSGSLGVTAFQQGEAIDTAIKRADDALYEAKNGGRNQVCVNVGGGNITPLRKSTAIKSGYRSAAL